ncbi:hypothetical protein [Chlamydia psittaci]|uniref:hypothetical protein n=1 Tax=Chlamydia psittaci TaxID=83554 RepID=UPI000FCAFCBB|nr:hypothetical protein [Chlamydia psittaci]AZU10559.1 hypothetical protein D3X08_02140 [Chlamydia psittaci]
MKDKTDNKVNDDFSLENIQSRVRAKVETNPALFTLTGSTITSTKPIDMNNQNISGLAAPKQNSDAVSLDYLQSNYVSKTDPNSGYLSTKGGTMSGNINMGGNSITNVKMPDATGESKTLDPSAAATVGYVMATANTVTNNPDINEAVTKLSGISSKVSVIEAALGIPPSQEAPPEGEEPEEPAPDTSLFVSISGSTMSGDLDMGNNAVKNIKTPTEANPKDAANVEYVQSKISTPQIGFLGNTITGSTSVTDYFDWKTPTPPPPPPAPAPATPVSPVSDPDESPVTPSPSIPKPVPPAPIRMEASQGGEAGTEGATGQTKADNVSSTPISDKYLKIEDSDKQTIKVLSTGILTLSVTANWSESTSANISVILNPSATGTESSEPANRTTKTDTVVYTVSAISGQNLFFQIPVQKPSDLKLKFTPPAANGTPSRASKTSLNLSSWSWQTTLLPSIFPAATTP